MASFEFAGGLSADLFNDIDDPFSGSVPIQDIENTLHSEPVPAQETAAMFDEHPGVADAIDAPFQAEPMAAPVMSRQSGLIMLPVPLFAARERVAAGRRTGWSERAMVLGLSTIIIAASVTAVREHKGDPRVAVWLTRGTAFWSALAPTELLIDEPAQGPVSVAELDPSLPSSLVAPSRPAAALLMQPRVQPIAQPIAQPRVQPKSAPPPAWAAQGTSEAGVLPSHAAQAAAPQQLPEVVFSSSHRRRAAVNERRAAPAIAQNTQHASKRALPPTNSAGRGDQASAARAQAREHYAARHYDQAIAAYEHAAKLEPGHALTFAGLGAARMQLRDTRGAVKAYERAVQLSPTSAVLQTSLTYAYLRDGNLRQARTSCARALALDPNNAAAKAACSAL